ncbi:MAG: hypothetical protein ABII68_01900 [Pseudomonadota bacterium]
MVKPYNPSVLLSKVGVFLQLHGQHADLLKHREHLEELVEQRTVELQNEITERKQAEEELEQHRNHLEKMVRKRTNELTAMVNAMAGHELRMADLKKVIVKLRTQMEEAGMTPVANDPLKERSDA